MILLSLAVWNALLGHSAAFLPAMACGSSTSLGDDDAPLQVRPGSQELFAHIQSTIEKIQSRTDRLASRAAKADDLKGKADSVRKEIVDIYRLIHSVELAGDDLLLRGERDGERVRERAVQLTGAIDSVVSALRSYLGSPPGLVNAATRRAKEQLGAVKQLDELIKQRKWPLAHQKLEDLLEAADEVGRFSEPGDTESLFRPLLQRMPAVRAGYLIEKKPSVLPALRDEFAAARPDVQNLRTRLASVADAARNMRELSWDEQSVTGPELVGQLADLWPKIDAAVLQAAAVLHAIGPSAETELRSLQSDYEAARVEAVTLVREVILADAKSAPPAAAESRYAIYLATIPRFMTAVHATPESALASSAALNQLAALSPPLEAKVQAYRKATSEAIRWRKRVAARYLKKFREQQPAETFPRLIDHPPARAAGSTGAPVLPGEDIPPEQRRTTQMAWTIDQSPESVAALWTEQWNGTPARIESASLLWPSSGELTFVSHWHRRVLAEVECARPTLLRAIDRLTQDLLLGPKRPPVTLESAMALYTAAHGPYAEIGGTLCGAVLENIPDRLFDSHDPNDMSGALAPSTLVAYPTMPALVRLQFKADWLVHDLFAESLAMPAAPSPTTSPPTAPSAPVASESPPPTDTRATHNAPSASSSAPSSVPAESMPGSPATSRPPAKREPPAPPPGGVRF